MLIIGIDEAGRGPVIGPLVICAFAVEEGKESELKRLGARDSKLLQAAARERIARKLEGFPHALVEISAEELTDYMRRKVSLNEMEAEKAVEAVKRLIQKNKLQGISKIIADSPDPNPKKFAGRIRKYLGKAKLLEDAQIISENKADFNFPVVGAASILAKSGRERRIEEIKTEIGGDFGSGYPSDERTRDYLKKHMKDPKLQGYIRHKWGTIAKLKTTDLKLKDFW